MDRTGVDAVQLDAALLEIEDKVSWDPATCFERSLELERQALAIGDALMAMRAQLCQANMRLRSGDLTAAARQISKVHQWAVEHNARRLTARIHLVWATIHRYLGDAARCLEHSVQAVELLDETATERMRIWHRVKLADALALAGSYEAARLRYRQAEALAGQAGEIDLLLGALNNFAYNELAAGESAAAQEIADRLVRRVLAAGFELDPDKLDTLGAIQLGNGRYADAERTMLLAIERHRWGAYDQDADSLAEFQLTLARAQRGLSAYDRAQESLDASRKLSLERDLADTLVRIEQEQAELHAARGEFADAFAVHKRFFTAFNKLHSQQREAQARNRQAMFEAAEARQEIPVGRAVVLLDGIRRAIGGYDWQALARGLPVTVSIGVAGVGEAIETTQAGLLSIADKNLYAAKHRGRDRVVWGVPDDTQTRCDREASAA